MWNKIYLGCLAASALALGILMYLSIDWLNSIGSPVIAVEKYNYYSNLSWAFLWISTLILLAVGNVVLWKLRKSWALWATLLYFAFFIVLQTFWLDQSLFQFKQKNGGGDGFSFSPFFGIALIVLAAIIVFFNQFLVKRLSDKMLPTEQPIEHIPENNLPKDDTI